MSTVMLSLGKFYSGTTTQTPRLAPTCSAMLVDTYLKDYTNKMCVNKA